MSQFLGSEYLTKEQWIVKVMLALALDYEVLLSKTGEVQLQAKDDEGLTIVWEYSEHLTTFTLIDQLGQVFIGEGINPKAAFARKELVKPLMQY